MSKGTVDITLAGPRAGETASVRVSLTSVVFRRKACQLLELSAWDLTGDRASWRIPILLPTPNPLGMCCTVTVQTQSQKAERPCCACEQHTHKCESSLCKNLFLSHSVG